MATSILRSPMLLRPLFFGPAKWPYIFVQKSLINAVTHGHILKSLTVDVFYNFTPLIRELIQNRKIKMPVSCQFHWPSKLSLLFFLFLDYSTWVRMWCNWCICYLRFYLALLVTGTDPGEGLAPSPLFLDQTVAWRETAVHPPPPSPTLSKGPHSPQSTTTIHTLPFTLTVITTNRQILKLLAFLFVKFTWNQTFGCYYGPKTV